MGIPQETLKQPTMNFSIIFVSIIWLVCVTLGFAREGRQFGPPRGGSSGSSDGDLKKQFQYPRPPTRPPRGGSSSDDPSLDIKKRFQYPKPPLPPRPPKPPRG